MRQEEDRPARGVSGPKNDHTQKAAQRAPEVAVGEAAELLRRREVPNPKEAKALYSQEKIAKAEFESRNA
jgi:hypothetical protein